MSFPPSDSRGRRTFRFSSTERDSLGSVLTACQLAISDLLSREGAIRESCWSAKWIQRSEPWLGPQHCVRQRYFEAPFDVVAFSAIAVKKRRAHYGYEGRSHSLWFCDAHEEGVYRWYELAFMVSPLIAQRFAFDPFQLLPTDPEAAKCLTPVVGTRQVAWQPVAIDQGQEGSFVERWMDWFAAAAEGTLSHPSHMPEDSGGHYRFDQRRRRQNRGG